MGTLYRKNITWQGLPTGNGLSTFYTTVASGDDAFLRTFYNSLGPYLPIGISIVFPPFGDIVDDTSGIVSGTWTSAPPTTVVASGSTNYAARAGACVSWKTATVVGRRRVQGRTFIVPLMSTAYDTDGTLGASTLNALQNAVNALTTSLHHLVVWHRPGKTGTGGISAPIVSGVVRDHVAVLATRAR